MKLTGYLYIIDIQVIYMCTCFKHLQVGLMGGLLLDDMEHVIRLPSKGQINVWRDNDLIPIDPREPHQIQILSHYGSETKHRWSYSTQADHCICDPYNKNKNKGNTAAYKPKYIIHQTHPVVQEEMKRHISA